MARRWLEHSSAAFGRGAWPSPRRLAGGPPEGRRSARCAGWHANCGRERPIGWLSSADAVSAASSRAQSARRASRGTEPQTPLSGARRAARRRRRARCARGPVQDVNGLQRGHAAEQKKRARRHGSLVRFSQFFMRQNRVRQRTGRPAGSERGGPPVAKPQNADRRKSTSTVPAQSVRTTSSTPAPVAFSSKTSAAASAAAVRSSSHAARIAARRSKGRAETTKSTPPGRSTSSAAAATAAIRRGPSGALASASTVPLSRTTSTQQGRSASRVASSAAKSRQLEPACRRRASSAASTSLSSTARPKAARRVPHALVPQPTCSTLPARKQPKREAHAARNASKLTSYLRQVTRQRGARSKPESAPLVRRDCISRSGKLRRVAAAPVRGLGVAALALRQARERGSGCGTPRSVDVKQRSAAPCVVVIIRLGRAHQGRMAAGAARRCHLAGTAALRRAPPRQHTALTLLSC